MLCIWDKNLPKKKQMWKLIEKSVLMWENLSLCSKTCFAGSRESRDSRDSPSIEVLSAPTSPTTETQYPPTTASNTQIGRNPLRGSKCNIFRFIIIFFTVSMHFNFSSLFSFSFGLSFWVLFPHTFRLQFDGLRFPFFYQIFPHTKNHFAVF